MHRHCKEAKRTRKYSFSPSHHFIEGSMNGANLPSREFLLCHLILVPLQTQTVCSIVRPYVTLYSHLALNGAITPASRLASSILTCFCGWRGKGRKASWRPLSHCFFDSIKRIQHSCLCSDIENPLVVERYRHSE